MKKQVTSSKQRVGRRSQQKRSQATVNMDNKHRISLTRVLSQEEKDHFSSFRMYREGGRIVLEPVIQIPEKNHWIYKDPKALASLMKGIKDAEEGRLYDLGSFSQYAIDNDQD